MQTTTELRRAYDSLIREATRLAGGLTDLAQRATVYHHLFEDSGGNHIFPLIAAHGALWARGYFALGMKLAQGLTWQHALSAETREQKMQSVADFADAFRDINRRVCVDTYASYHFIARHGQHPDAAQFVRPHLLDALNRIHSARRNGQQLSDDEKRRVFEVHFLNEQETVVGPSIQRAVELFDWPLLKFIALRPVVRFAYFPARQFFWFRSFDRREERIEKGLRAFDIGAQAGWDNVAAALRAYDILPAAFFAGSHEYFAATRTSILAAVSPAL
jgi:hypothetical protein